MMNNYRSRLAPACLLAASAMLAACSTTPADPGPETAVSAVETSPTVTDKEVTSLEDDGIRCRRVTKTGTHMYKRVCTTAAQREQMRQDAERLGRDGQRMADTIRNQAVVARDAAREVYR